jgi:hypothetical protein
MEEILQKQFFKKSVHIQSSDIGSDIRIVFTIL